MNLRLITFAWDISLGSFRVAFFVWGLSLDVFYLGEFVRDVPPGILFGFARLGTLLKVLYFRLGIPLRMFGLGTIAASEGSL